MESTLSYKYTAAMTIPLLASISFISLIPHESQLSKKIQPQMEITEFAIYNAKQYQNFFAAKASFGSTSFLQSAFWGQFKSKQGWRPHYFYGKIHESKNFEYKEEYEFAFLVLSRSLLPKALPALFSIAYIPFGPIFSHPQNASCEFSKLVESWNPFADSQQYFTICRLIGQKLLGYIPLSCFFIRLDSNYLLRWQPALPSRAHAAEAKEQAEVPKKSQTKLDTEQPMGQEFGFCRAIQRVQVPTTVLLEIHCSEEQLLSQMHKKHRYNIRLAQKKGVEIHCIAAWGNGQDEQNWQESLEEWYRLYQITAERDQIGIHKFSYYRSLFEQQREDAQLFLYLAYSRQNARSQDVEETARQILAGIIVLHCGQTATYLYGASANEHRKLMPNYLLQWQAICQARTAGLQYYDFFGIPAHADPKDPLHGLYRFKVGFGGYLIQRSGAWDLAYSKVFYGLYRLLEKIRLLLYHLRHRGHRR